MCHCFDLVKVAESEKKETITKNDAMQFPIVASGMLLGIYVIFKVMQVEYACCDLFLEMFHDEAIMIFIGFIFCV